MQEGAAIVADGDAKKAVHILARAAVISGIGDPLARILLLEDAAVLGQRLAGLFRLVDVDMAAVVVQMPLCMRQGDLHRALGQKKYYSCCRHSDFIIGNSSSGLLEMPSFKKFSINIGDRQLGRVKAKSVINCDTTTKSMIRAIKYSLNPVNKLKLKHVINPYGKGGASKKIVNILKNKKFDNLILKGFFDIKFK